MRFGNESGLFRYLDMADLDVFFPLPSWHFVPLHYCFEFRISNSIFISEHAGNVLEGTFSFLQE